MLVRPELLTWPVFWSSVADMEGALRLIREARPNLEGVCAAMVVAVTDSTAIASAVRELGEFDVLQGLQTALERNTQGPCIWEWLSRACAQPLAIASFLSDLPAPNAWLLESTTECVAPDEVLNDYGQDPWLTASLALQGSSGGLPVKLYSYGFRRALGLRTRSVAELL